MNKSTNKQTKPSPAPIPGWCTACLFPLDQPPPQAPSLTLLLEPTGPHRAHWSVCLFVCLFVLTALLYACGGTATSETAFPGHPGYPRVTAGETWYCIATSCTWCISLVMADPVTVCQEKRPLSHWSEMEGTACGSSEEAGSGCVPLVS